MSVELALRNREVADGRVARRHDVQHIIVALAERGVAHTGADNGNLPPFSWQASGFTQPLHVPTDTFKFPVVKAKWSNKANSELLNEATTIASTTVAATASNFRPGPLALLQMVLCFLFSSYCQL